MIVKKLTQEDIKKMLEGGKAIRVHLYNAKNVLKPRGTMEKESVGLYLYEKMLSCFEDWTDKKYGDNPPVEVLMQTICDNLREECASALEHFFSDEKVAKKFSEITNNLIPK